MINKREDMLQSIYDFCDALKIDLGMVKDKEMPEKIHVRGYQLKRDSIERLTEAHLRSLFRAWGNNFECEISSYIRNFILRKDTYERELPVLLDQIAHLSVDDTVGLNLTIEKEKFLKENGIESPNAKILLYLFQDNVIRILEGEFETIEKTFFKDEKLKTVVLILDVNEYVSGHHLAFIGGKFIENHLDKTQLKKPPRMKQIEQIRETRANEISWRGINTELTPVHFLYREHLGESNRIRTSIDILLINFVILYLADRSEIFENHILATFIGTNEATIKIARKTLRIESLNLQYLIQLFRWAYSINCSDKLSVIRNMIPLDLEADPIRNCQLLIERAEHIYVAVRSNYRVYISRATEKYFKTRKEAIDYEATLSRKHSEQISEMTKSLVANMLATIAAVFGVFLAYAVSSKFKPIVFNYGLKMYAVYILSFPCAYAMSHAFLEYINMKSDFKNREKLFSDFMAKKEIEKIFGATIPKLEKQFIFWFLLTVGIYILIAALAWRISSMDITELLSRSATVLLSVS
jgi:hypothetical protein